MGGEKNSWYLCMCVRLYVCARVCMQVCVCVCVCVCVTDMWQEACSLSLLALLLWFLLCLHLALSASVGLHH